MAIIYETINTFNRDNGIMPWRYSGSDLHERDEYFGSNKELKADIDRLGIKHFEKTILMSVDNKAITSRELRVLESKIQTVENHKDTDCYGKKGMRHSKKRVTSQKWIDSMTGTTWSDQAIARRTEEGNPMFGRKASEETRAKMRKRSSGANNSNALSWKITDPEGDVFQIKALRSWCKEKNLDYITVYHSRKGFQTTRFGHGKGGRKNVK